MLEEALPEVLDGADREAYEARSQALKAAGVPERLACKVASMPGMVSVFDIVETARQTGWGPEQVTVGYFTLASRLDLNWLRNRIIELPRGNRWQALARAALRDELYDVHRALAQEVLESSQEQSDPEAAIEAWAQRNADAVQRCQATLSDIRASRIYDTTTLPVALREVRNLIRA
jgi:glutamate dehydrogenase